MQNNAGVQYSIRDNGRSGGVNVVVLPRYLNIVMAVVAGFWAPNGIANDDICGAIISTKHRLDDTLICTKNPALIVLPGGEVDFHGFTLDCKGEGGGVIVAGDHVSLYDGNIENCLFGLNILGNNNSFGRMTVSGSSSYRFMVVGSDNRLISTTPQFNRGNDYETLGNHNAYEGNIAESNDGSGFLVLGSKNQFSKNQSDENGRHGIQVGSVVGSNVFLYNDIQDNGQVGILVSNSKNEFREANVVDNNPIGVLGLAAAGGNEFINNKFYENRVDIVRYVTRIEGTIESAKDGEKMEVMAMDPETLSVTVAEGSAVLHIRWCGPDRWSGTEFDSGYPVGCDW